MVRRSILSSVREEQPANAESVEPVQEPILQPVSRVKRKRVVLAVCTGCLGSEKMCSCRKQRMVVSCRYGLLVGDGAWRSGG